MRHFRGLKSGDHRCNQKAIFVTVRILAVYEKWHEKILLNLERILSIVLQFDREGVVKTETIGIVFLR